MKPIDPKYGIEVIDGDPYIVKTGTGMAIANDEPLILFRARDKLALPMLKAYRELCVADGCNEYQLAGIDNRIAAFEAFQKSHAKHMKQPGITRGK